MPVQESQMVTRLRPRWRLAFKMLLIGIPALACLALTATLLGYIASAEVVFYPEISCVDPQGSGRLVHCPPGAYEGLEEYVAQQRGLRTQGYTDCYSGLARRLPSQYRLVEDLIIGYCMHNPSAPTHP